MRVTHLTPSLYRSMPWKNGRGTTTEIAREPASGEFEWRISAAAVSDDGPFSPFPGYDRVILTLEGEGMILTHREKAEPVILRTLEPYSFSGDWTTDCVLRSGPIRDFNVIARRGSFVPEVEVVNLPDGLTIVLRSETTLLYCARGAVTIEGTATALRKEETLVLERTAAEGESVSLRRAEGGTTVIVVELRRELESQSLAL